jgi:hypothetical protein
MEPVTVELNLERSTKNTHVYSTGRTNVAVPSIYIKKVGAFASEAPPNEITVTITVKS